MSNFIDTCIFPVAGKGSRFYPVTKSVPKELLPVLAKPLIHYAVDEAVAASAKNLILITSENKPAIRHYFSENEKSHKKLKKLEAIISDKNFIYINQEKQLGLGHAILQANDYVLSDAFGVILPDDFCLTTGDNVLQQMAKVYSKYPGHCIVGIEEVAKENIPNYGVISIESELAKNLYRLKGLVEKPEIEKAPSNLAVIGRYILTKDIFEIIKHTSKSVLGEIQITSALNILAQQGKVIAYKFTGERFDCGSVEGYVKANVRTLKNEQFF